METTTGEDGRFRFEEVLKTPCEIRVGAEGYAPSGVDTYSGDVSVEVVLRRAASVEGLIVDGLGRPVAATLLRLSDPRLIPGDEYDFDDVDDSGTFRLERRNPGKLRLRAVTGDGREGEASVEVREGEEIRGLRIQVKPPWRSHVRVRALVAKGSLRSVEFVRDGEKLRAWWQGDVATLPFRDPPGASVPLCVREDEYPYKEMRMADRVLETAPLTDSAVIDVLLPELVPVRLETDPPIARPQPDFHHFTAMIAKRDGAWLLSPDCSYSVTMSPEGFLPVEVKGWRPPAGGGVLNVPLREASVLRGMVLDAEGAPVEGATCSLGPLDPLPTGPEATTGPDGRFAIATAPSGEQILVASRKCRPLAAARVRLEPGRETDAGALVAWRWRKIRGQVLDEARRPLGGAAVTFVAVLAGDGPPAMPYWSSDTYSHADGAYEIAAPEADGFLLAAKRGYGTTPVRPDRAEDIVLPRPAFVHVDATGAAGGDGVLWTCSVRWPEILPDAVWEPGGFLPHTLEVAPGRIEVSAELWDTKEPKGTHTVEAAQGATAQVTFER